jgi:ribonuclease-3
MTISDEILDLLERRLGYRFQNRDLARTALTHSSASLGPENYQRLEFLGDRVLGLVVTEMLIDAFPQASEGELSRRLADLVRKEKCAEVAVGVDLAAAIRVGGGQAARGGILTTNVLADVCEAVIAAIYRDGGYEAARGFIFTHWHAGMLARPGNQQNAKAALQEWSQARGAGVPDYAIAGRSGPDHEPEFDIEVRVGDLPPERGSGRSRREAENAAATAMLVRERVWQRPE